MKMLSGLLVPAVAQKSVASQAVLHSRQFFGVFHLWFINKVKKYSHAKDELLSQTKIVGTL